MIDTKSRHRALTIFALVSIAALIALGAATGTVAAQDPTVCEYDDIQAGETTSDECDFGDDHLFEGELVVDEGGGGSVGAGAVGSFRIVDDRGIISSGFEISVAGSSNDKNIPSDWYNPNGDGLKGGTYEWKWRGGNSHAQTELTVTGPGGTSESISVGSTRGGNDVEITLAEGVAAKNMRVKNF